MARGVWQRALLALALGAAGTWQPAGAAEFRCWNGDLVRRIELSALPETGEGVACEVRYWRNARIPETGRSLWRASRDTDFCVARTRELLARLEAGGWTCSAGEQAASAAPMQPAETDPEPSPRAESRPAAVAREEVTRAFEPASPDATSPAASPPPAAAQGEPAAPSADPATLAVLPPPPAVSPAEPPSLARSEPSAADEPAAAPPAHANAALLDQVVEQTLRSVQELYDGQFQAALPSFGDLDHDGLEDAAVLVTYQPNPNEYVQYLVAYLFDGETFQSVATRNVGGRFLDALRADLQGIADGKILLEIEVLHGDAACCARRPAAFALENGQLVEIDHPGGASLERTSEAERPSPG
jgi:hypothetical protein